MISAGRTQATYELPAALADDLDKLEQMVAQVQAGELLSITVGAEGAENVPRSAEADGHEVLSVAHEGDHWRILIRKGGG